MSENVRTDIDVTGPLQTRTQIKPASHKSAHPVLAAHSWKQNSDMIADAAKLGYLDGAVLDLSYGHGKFWKQWRPDKLTTNDLDPTKGHHHFDVNDPAPDHWAEAFNAVVWDGPYRLSGTRDRGDFDEQYGLRQPVNADETMALLKAGVDFAALCTRPGGHVLIKSQPQVVSGHKVWQPRLLVEHGESAGLTLVHELFLVRPPRPQPVGRRQVHSRSNYSVLSIMRKPKTKGANHNRGETSKRKVLVSPLRLVAPVLAVLVGLVAGCSTDQGEAFDVAVAATVEALRAEVPTFEPTVVEPTATPEPVPTMAVTYDETAAAAAVEVA